ncbi:MAG: hypothetical protein DRH06_00335 [Deltaproteobacteria bacterium]|nr:MAG: hypothetical protein DRH06_00335 [Deltaproteobacteria bacterium]
MFSKLKEAISKQFEAMKNKHLFVTDISGDVLWEAYLASFPAGTNPMHNERTEHDCQSCKRFIKSVGNVVSIEDDNLMSIWDIKVDGFYQVVADKMSALVKSFAIKNILLRTEKNIGVDFNFGEAGFDSIIPKWEHLYVELPVHFVSPGDSIGGHLAQARSSYDVFKRGLEEITVEAVEQVLELIDQGSLYRGEEHMNTLESFLIYKRDYLKATKPVLYAWKNSRTAIMAVSRIRNTSIGTLLLNISEGQELDYAVSAFEKIVAPTNYKRPKSLVTASMIKNAQTVIGDLGFLDSLPRRHAVYGDLTINNVLHANRKAKSEMDVFEELTKDIDIDPQVFTKVEEVSIETFITKIMPTTTDIKIMVDNSHENNFFSLFAPLNPDAKKMFKWDNNFSWTYKGSVADSIKERVKAAGGNVDGDLRCSLSWFNRDDLDIHLKCPGNIRIYYGDKTPGGTKGKLDVDMNAGGPSSLTPVENITFSRASQIQEGEYELIVNNFSMRDSGNVGCEVEIEFMGNVLKVCHPKPIPDGANVSIAKFSYTKKYGMKIISLIESTPISRKIWGIDTMRFQPVSMVMHSPNHWDGQNTGNKHYFFIIEDCKCPDKSRGFFNEFLTNELTPHRKVMEVLGDKLKVESASNQLSGVGFSSTQRNHILCQVTGKFTRVVKILF